MEAVKTFKQPKTKKDVRSFLGLCGDYRKFSPNFHLLPHPSLTLQGKVCLSRLNGIRCEKAFIELKEVLSRAPILVTPDWTKAFILQTRCISIWIGLCP